MTPVRPRRLVHRGVVRAAGFLVDVELLGEAASRRRVLAAWRPGTAVERLGRWLVVLPPAPVMTGVEHAPGTPLVRGGGVLLAAPLEDDELKALEPLHGSVIAVRGGTASALPPSARVREEPAAWLDTGAFALVEVESLGERAAPPVSPIKVTVELRERLAKALPPAAPGMNEVRAALKAALGQAGARRAPVWERWLERLAELFRPRPSTATGSRGTALSMPPAPRGPSLLDRLSAGLQRAAAGLLRASRLGWLVGRAQAKYLGRMMKMFEQGDLSQALRHAVPLGGEAGEGIDRPALGTPAPRDELSIRPQPAPGGGAGIGLGDALMAELRRLYRQAFERLRAQGRIDEAAFVLAELLHANEEAVSFLEAHGRLRLAAEVAEARGLPPGLVVRQWFLANDAARAVLVARRTGAFADAVQRLERTHPAEARELRRAWARSLAEAGSFGPAVDAVWESPRLRAEAKPWLDALIELGGTVGAQALVRKLVVEPSDFPRVRGLALELLEDDSRERARERQVFARALGREGEVPELMTLARPAVRALVRDRALHGTDGPPVDLEALAGFAKDGALRTDLPLITPPRGGHRGDRTVTERTFEANDTGVSAVLDAVPLPKGRLLVALGEQGARLLSRDGRTLHHFDVPAHRLVMSDNGDRAIALAPRGDATRLSRLDLLGRRAQAWCDARVDVAACDYDGSLWYVAERDAVFAVDALAQGFRALWKVDALGGKVAALARSPQACAFVVDGVPPERWLYELPGEVLRHRSALEAPRAAPSSSGWLIGQAPAGMTGMVRPFEQNASRPGALYQMMVHEGAANRREYLFESDGTPRAPVVGHAALALPMEHEGAVTVLVMDVLTWSLAGRFVFQGATRVSARIWQGTLVLCDDRGRLVLYELETRTVQRDLRV